jgi:hypothetical protein
VVFAVLVSALVAILAGSLVFLFQAYLATQKDRGPDDALFARLDAAGSLTPLAAAAALGISVFEADRRLRALVDDERVKMEIDLVEGALRFVRLGASEAAASYSRSAVTPATSEARRSASARAALREPSITP